MESENLYYVLHNNHEQRERKIGLPNNPSIFHFLCHLNGGGVKTVKEPWSDWPMDPTVFRMYIFKSVQTLLYFFTFKGQREQDAGVYCTANCPVS